MKDNNKPVNDIFQDDSGSKNKTKTILLLTIVAIILIAVFLIIAWVMTRDNPLQDMQKEHEQTSLNQPIGRPTPPANSNNMENGNPFGIDTNRNVSLPSEDSSLPNTAMSNTPPIGVPMENTITQTSANTKIPENKDSEKNNEFENDAKYQAAFKDLEKQHADKKNAETKKEVESPKAKEHAQAKVVVPPLPKETVIVPALDPTKSSQKAKDSEKSSHKPKPKEQAKPAETKKPNTQATSTNATQKSKDSEKPVEQAKPKPVATQKAESKEQNKVIQKPQNSIVSENQGKAPEKGHYMQVGAFTDQDKITTEFLNKISKYNYRILKVDKNGTTSAKYLIGPYKTRGEVKQIEAKVRTEINQGAFYVDLTK